MARRQTDRLTHREVLAMKTPGRHADGRGLNLVVDETATGEAGAKRWVFIFQWDGRRKEMGLGSVDDVSLKDAREKCTAARKLVADGKNPIEERRLERERLANLETPKTFGEWAEEIAPAVGPKAVKARKAWVSMMKDKTGALAALPPAAIGTEQVLRALKPYWESRPESGRRMRMRIELVLDAAKAKDMIPEPWQNPARLKGHLDLLLAKRTTPVKHHRALPYDEMPKFWAKLTERKTMAALALQFTILTIARTKETLGALDGEVDAQLSLWTVPPERMKGLAHLRREHRVPLVETAAGVVTEALELRREPHGGLIFPSTLRLGRAMSDAAMERVLDDLGLKGKATVHGFRSTFKDWAEDTTDFANGTIEAALAHLVGDETERAYRRGDGLEKRRKLMEAWESFITGRNVVALRRVGG